MRERQFLDVGKMTLHLGRDLVRYMYGIGKPKVVLLTNHHLLDGIVQLNAITPYEWSNLCVNYMAMTTLNP